MIWAAILAAGVVIAAAVWAAACHCWGEKLRNIEAAWRRVAGDAVAVPMGAAKLIEAFQGAEGTEVFRGVLCVCRGERDLARANAAIAMAKKQERAYWCGAMRALEEMEERLMDLAARSSEGGGAGAEKSQGARRGNPRRPVPAVMGGGGDGG